MEKEEISLKAARERSIELPLQDGHSSATLACIWLPLCSTVTVLPQSELPNDEGTAMTLSLSLCLVPHEPVVPCWRYQVAWPEWARLWGAAETATAPRMAAVRAVYVNCIVIEIEKEELAKKADMSGGQLTRRKDKGEVDGYGHVEDAAKTPVFIPLR